jgi:hypothetical protein
MYKFGECLLPLGYTLYSRLLPGNEKLKIHKNVILSAVLHRCETWSRNSRVLRAIFEPRRERKEKEGGENSKIGSYIICSLHKILLDLSNKE